MAIVRYRERLLFMVASRWRTIRGGATEVGERVLIVGAGDGGQLTTWLLEKSNYSNWFTIVGFVDDDPQKFVFAKIGYPVLGTTGDIPDIVEKWKVGLIFFAISNITEDDRERILAICRSTPAKLAFIKDLNRVLDRSIMELDIEPQQ